MTATPIGIILAGRHAVRGWWCGCPSCKGERVEWRGEVLTCLSCEWRGSSAAELVRLREDINAGKYNGPKPPP